MCCGSEHRNLWRHWLCGSWRKDMRRHLVWVALEFGPVDQKQQASEDAPSAYRHQSDNPFECQEGASGDSVVSGPCALYTVLNCDIWYQKFRRISTEFIAFRSFAGTTPRRHHGFARVLSWSDDFLHSGVSLSTWPCVLTA